MDKEEFRIKLEEINHLVEEQDYKGAMNVVDSIDWRRVKNVRTLCVVGEIYAANKRYDDAKEIFLLAYHRAPIGKNILYRLIEVSLKMGDIDEAMEFFEEYEEVAANDNTRYVLKYKIFKAKRASLNEQIKILEEYKNKEFTERWSYELAKLYYKAGDKEKCLDLCNEIVLWFNDGKYVMKALDLKMRMGELTGAEKEKYEQQFIPKLITPEEAKALKENDSEDLEEEEAKDESVEEKEPASSEKEEPRIESIRIRGDKDLSGTESLQEKISKGIRDIFGGKKKSEEEDLSDDEDFMEEEEVREEMIKNTSSQEEYENVPNLEPEGIKPFKEEEISFGQKKQDFAVTMKMPELKIPESMRNIDPKEALVMPEIPVPKVVSTDFLETSDEEEGKKEFDFNLEDTILAAATAQGIEIPKEAPAELKEETEEVSPEEGITEKGITEKDITEKNITEKSLIEKDLAEDDLTEEDLQEAEAEFLKGPAEKEPEIPDLEPEEIIPEEIINKKKEEISDLEDDEFISNILKKEMKEEEAAGGEPAAEAGEEEETEETQEAEETDEKEKPLTQEEELEQFIESIQPNDESDPMDIVPREKKLREDEKKLFTYFVKVPGMREQLISTLCDVQASASDKTSNTGNIIIMGGRETGKTRLISSLIPAICKELNLEASKVAYVFAEQINGKDIKKIADKLAGGFLVIENANQLGQDTADQLDKVMESCTDGLTVIIEDEKIGMRKLIARYPKFAKKFTSMINIPVFTNDELVNFAKVYTKENGYTIDQMGMLALYNLIGINQKEDEPMSIGAVKELVDTAIAKSQGGIRKLKRNISKKRTDRDGFVVLYEKDFS